MSVESKLKEKLLNESSLSRVLKHMKSHDSGTITAFRNARDCNSGEPYSKKENLQRNESLRAKLNKNGYGLTRVLGKYVEDFGAEDAKAVKEVVFFVVDLKDSGNLRKDLQKLGAEFEQDSILFVPKGGKVASLIGTSVCPDAFPKKGKMKIYNKRGLGKDGMFSTMVNGRPYVFESNSIPERLSYIKGVTPMRGCHAVANSPWQELDV